MTATQKPGLVGCNAMDTNSICIRNTSTPPRVALLLSPRPCRFAYNGRRVWTPSLPSLTPPCSPALSQPGATTLARRPPHSSESAQQRQHLLLLRTSSCPAADQTSVQKNRLCDRPMTRHGKSPTRQLVHLHLPLRRPRQERTQCRQSQLRYCQEQQEEEESERMNPSPQARASRLDKLSQYRPILLLPRHHHHHFCRQPSIQLVRQTSRAAQRDRRQHRPSLLLLLLLRLLLLLLLPLRPRPRTQLRRQRQRQPQIQIQLQLQLRPRPRPRPQFRLIQ